MMELLITMPTWLGEQFYPGGFPIPFNKISVDSISLIDRFMRSVNDKGIFKATGDDESVLRDYILYYLNAPCWKQIDCKGIEKMSYSELFDFCMDNGLDPF